MSEWVLAVMSILSLQEKFTAKVSWIEQAHSHKALVSVVRVPVLPSLSVRLARCRSNSRSRQSTAPPWGLPAAHCCGESPDTKTAYTQSSVG